MMFILKLTLFFLYSQSSFLFTWDGRRLIKVSVPFSIFVSRFSCACVSEHGGAVVSVSDQAPVRIPVDASQLFVFFFLSEVNQVFFSY